MQDVIICRCEEVTLQDVKDAAKKYNCSARELKLRTRAGMGFCAGRTCRPVVDQLLSEISNEKPADAIPLKVAPPVRPISLANLGGIVHETD